VTASEFSFLALGLVLGIVTGAALVELVRARPPAPREVKLTVAHDAIPRRATTLADDAFVAAGPEPARGGPADRRQVGGTTPDYGSERRTTVRFSGPAATADPIPVARQPAPPMPGRIMEPALPLTGPDPDPDSQPPMVGIPISSGEDPVLWRSASERQR
jgi:hypothetical protein